ncbi:MAG: DUF3108 domain-containing protein [Oceanospirillales bacterium]|nr:DUF3108 domain-containing protein [Oceanospirillales bacterium]
MKCAGKFLSAVAAALLATSVSAQAESARQACAEALLQDSAGVDLSYRVDWKGLSLESTRRIERLDTGGWQARNLSSLLFMTIEENSQFELRDGLIQSRSYNYQRKGMSKKQNLKLEFAEGYGYRAFSPKGDGRVSHPAPLFDLLNHQVQLRIDLACSAPRDEYVYDIARRSRVSEYRYRRVGEESVTTPAGTFNALRLERGDAGDRLDQVWLAPKLGYLIVKLVHQEDDETAELVLTKMPGGSG